MGYRIDNRPIPPNAATTPCKKHWLKEELFSMFAFTLSTRLYIGLIADRSNACALFMLH